MKKILFLLIFLTINNDVFSQVITGKYFDNLGYMYYFPTKQKVIDESVLNVTYEYSYLLDTTSSKRYYDRYLLQIGKSTTRFFSLYAQRCDSISYTNDLNTTQQPISATKWLKSTERPQYMEYYTFDSPDIIKFRRAVGHKYYEYDEPQVKFEWQIKDESQTILGYSCQVAVTTFRGRTWKVWFSPDIASQGGPWKLHGLPGLILKAQDDSGYFSYTAIGINSKKEPINITTHTFVKIKREQMLKLESRFYLDPMGLMVENGIPSVKMKHQGSFITLGAGSIVNPYIPPLELE